MVRIAIVGGGVSGLALAYRLHRRLPAGDVLVLEAADRLGGTIRTEDVAGYRVEHGPNGFLDNKPGTLALANDLGLGGDLLAASDAAGKNRFLFLRGRLRKLPTGLVSFLFSSALSWSAKWAVLTERYRKAPPPPGEEAFADFMARRVSREVADTFADAFVSGIYAGDATKLSVQAAFPRLAAFEREHGSLFGGMFAAARARRKEGRPASRGRMWSFPAGMGTLIDRLVEALPRAPITGVAVRAVVRRGDGPGYRVLGDGGGVWEADRVVLACPAYRQAEILADLDPALADLVAAVPYSRVAVVALGYAVRDVATPLDGFGYLTPGRDRRDVLGVQWCSSIFPGERSPRGTVLLRAMCGGAHRPEMVDWPDDRLLAAVRAELAVTMKVAVAPAFHRIVRWDRAIPQYHVGHLDRLGRIDALAGRHPGLHLAGNAYRGVALNDCAENAELLAERIAADVSA